MCMCSNDVFKFHKKSKNRPTLIVIEFLKQLQLIWFILNVVKGQKKIEGMGAIHHFSKKQVDKKLFKDFALKGNLD